MSNMENQEIEQIFRKYIMLCFVAICTCITFMSVVGYGGIVLFPQIKHIIITIGAGLARKDINTDTWTHRLQGVSLTGFIISTLLFIFSFKALISRISIKKKDISYNIIIAFLIGFYSLMLVILASTSNDLWTDEALTFMEIKFSLKDFDWLNHAFPHPLFYFIFAKCYSLFFGGSIFAMKLFSTIPTILMVIFATLFLKSEFSYKTALFFLLSCFASESITHFSIEIRMYSWALFFLTMMAISSWFFIKSEKKYWRVILLLCALGAAYTHYHSLVTAGFMYLLLLFYIIKYRKDKIYSAVFVAITAIILYSPQLFLLLRSFGRLSSNFWIPKLTLTTVLDSILMVFYTGYKIFDIVFILLFLTVLTISLIRKNKTEKDFFAFYVLISFLLFLLFMIAFSIIAAPTLVNRYLVPSYGLIWLFFSIECSAISNKRITAFFCIILFTIGLMSFSFSINKERNKNHQFYTFYNTITEKLKSDDSFLIISANDEVGKSYHIYNILRYYFYDHDINFINYDGYDPESSPARTTWILLNTTWRVGIEPNNIAGDFKGYFGWNGTHPHWDGTPGDFKLFYYSP